MLLEPSAVRASTVRLVIDVNIMIRALLSDGPARRFFELGPVHHSLVFHHQQLAEVRDVAGRARLRLPPTAVEEFVERMLMCCEVFEGALPVVEDCRDPDDNYALALALAGKAEVILTEDQDLLTLDPWRDIRIMRLHHFLDQHPLAQPPNAI